MPGGEVRKVPFDHFGRVVELFFCHTASLLSFVALPPYVKDSTFKNLNDLPPIAPAMKVPIVSTEHLAHKSKFFLPKVSSRSYWEAQCSLLKKP